MRRHSVLYLLELLPALILHGDQLRFRVHQFVRLPGSVELLSPGEENEEVDHAQDLAVVSHGGRIGH